MPESTVEEILRDHFWLCVQNPREVPRKGGPFPRGSMAKVLREWMRANPEAQITVVTLHEWGPDFWHGPEQLEMLDRRSSPFARRHNAAVDAARLRAQPPADTQDGWQTVPREPTEAMWGGLARDLMMWNDMGPRPTGQVLFRHLHNLGREIPDWLREMIPDVDHVPSKGTRAVAIYRAMLAAAPAAPSSKPGDAT